MSAVGAFIELCIQQAERELEEEREFQRELASIPKTINININVNSDSKEKIDPIVIDSI